MNENSSLFGRAQFQIDLKPHVAIEAVAPFQETAPAYKAQARRKSAQIRS